MAEGFWLTDIGIKLRFHQLAQLVVTRTYNRALQMYAPQLGVKEFAFMTMRDNKVCPICFPLDVRNSGRTYKAGQFMPFLPRHPGGRCYYDVFIGVG